MAGFSLSKLSHPTQPVIPWHEILKVNFTIPRKVFSFQFHEEGALHPQIPLLIKHLTLMFSKQA
jgi:hypothetical protein